jgi:cold shock CspA family protein
MQTDGTLTRWNDERGFGFITPRRGGQDIFVDISAFPQDGRRPQCNEILSFEIDTDKNGKKRAVHVSRPASKKKMGARPSQSPHPQRKSHLTSLLASLALFIAISVYGYTGLYGKSDTVSAVDTGKPAENVNPIPDQEATAEFQCDGRTSCSQMRSCDEAKFFLKHCPDGNMDSNHDGIPCEKQWCTGMLSN